jgi:hypothetical protein
MDDPLDLAFVTLGVMAAVLATQPSMAMSSSRHTPSRFIALTWESEFEGMTCALLGTIDCPGLGGVLVGKR